MTSTGVGTGTFLFAPTILRAQEKGILKVAAIQAVTGQSAAPGIRGRDGSILAVEDINAGGGWKDSAGKVWTVDLQTADMANDPKQAITLLRQFARDPSVLALIAPTSSVGYVPLVPAAGQLSFPMIGSGSGAPIKEWNIHSYRVNPVSSSAVPVLLKQMVAHEKVKVLAVIYDQTQDGNLADAEICKRMAPELGYTLSAYEAFRAGDQEFSPQIAKIRMTRPDAIYVAAAPSDGMRIVPQIREAGIDKPLLTGFGGFHDPVYWDNTTGGIKGCYTWLAQDLNAPGAQLKSFVTRYNTKFSTPANSFSTYGYDAVFAILEAFKKAGAYDRQKVVASLQTLDMTTPLGTPIKFKNPPSGDNLNPSVVIIQIDGRGTYKVIA
jgi:branched-chain amino acid transport system substrate-binding protein